MFHPIDEPGLHGTEATKGDRSVKVVRCYDGEWTIFRRIGGKVVRGSVADTSRSQAMRLAIQFLDSTIPLDVWPNS